MQRPSKDIVEIFGYAPNDISKTARSLWSIGACPFINLPCTKTNHDKSIVYGTCSVSTPYGNCIICPNRLYASTLRVIKNVAEDAFGKDVPFLTYSEYVKNCKKYKVCAIALGMYSGKEVKVGRSLSMDWVLAKLRNGKLEEYTGIEVQSIDITGNYRDNWYAYKSIDKVKSIPSSEHGLNWANVHKRLIPQIIRKSLVYSRSEYVKSGLYFILPDVVYSKFEEIIGNDIPLVKAKSPDVITVHTYSLGESVKEGQQRKLIKQRALRFTMNEFSKRFISGPNLPPASELDFAIKGILGIK
jgi:hypothetical protein